MPTLKLLNFAFKQEWEYKINFFYGMISMIVNDSLYLMVFLIFFSYFSGIGLGFGDILLVRSLAAFYYGICLGLFSNIGILDEIIETGKLDYYLGFPINPLKLIATSKISIFSLGDALFACMLILLYMIYYGHMDLIFFIKWIIIVVFGSMFLCGFYIFICSLSFFMERGSFISGIFKDIFLIFFTWHYKIYENNKFIYYFVSVIGLYPTIILPLKMIESGGSIYQWIFMASCGILMLLISIYTFNKGLSRYKSGNLVHQM